MGSIFDKNSDPSVRTITKPDMCNGFTVDGLKSSDTASQDCFEIFDLENNGTFFGVYDGHGNKGKQASLLLRSKIKEAIMNQLKESRNFFLNNRNNCDVIKKFYENTFLKIQEHYAKIGNDFELSGSCASCVHLIDDYCYFINLGDSRIVMGSKKNLKKVSFEMSSDHKPNQENEERRILQQGGRVVSNNGSIYRVCRKNEDLPNLAVSRSIGDLIGHTCGVSSIPDVIVKEMDFDDKFLIIGSDGLWDMLSSAEVVGVIFHLMEDGKFNMEESAKKLVEECRYRWEMLNVFKEKYIQENLSMKQEDNDYICDIDDITAVICFLNKSLS